MDLVKKSLLKASAATLLLILLGVLVGLQMDDMRQGYLESELKTSVVETESFTVVQDYLDSKESQRCNLLDVQIPEIATRSSQLGAELNRLESREFVSDKVYERIRRQYYNNQLRLLTSLENYEERCGGSNQTSIIYFFDESTASQRQGAVLDDVVRQSNVQVFSFNSELDDSMIVDVLKREYNVTQEPTVVIEDRKYEGFQSEYEINQEINSTE
jgi:hypothetical protein